MKRPIQNILAATMRSAPRSCISGQKASGRRRGLISLETLATVVFFALAATCIYPYFLEARQIGRREQSILLLRQVAAALANYAIDTGELPVRFYPEVTPYLNPDLAELTRLSELGRQFDPFSDDAPPPDAVPYFVLSNRNGQVVIAAGLGLDPLRYTGRDYVDNDALAVFPCLTEDCGAFVADARITSHEVVSQDLEFPDYWSWDPGVQHPKVRTFHDAAFVLPTVRSAETITAILGDHPDLIRLLRRSMDWPEVRAAAFSLLDPDGDGAVSFGEFVAGPGAMFQDLLGAEPDDPEPIAPLPLEALRGGTELMFSYETLRVLSRFYVQQTGIYDALAATLDAAEAAEKRADLRAKTGQIRAYQSAVQALTNKALSPYQANVLLTFSAAL